MVIIPMTTIASIDQKEQIDHRTPTTHAIAACNRVGRLGRIDLVSHEE